VRRRCVDEPPPRVWPEEMVREENCVPFELCCPVTETVEVVKVEFSQG